ncbi:hypothetical protein EJB05_16358, partial [Eragrostis curvula]
MTTRISGHISGGAIFSQHQKHTKPSWDIRQCIQHTNGYGKIKHKGHVAKKEHAPGRLHM